MLLCRVKGENIFSLKWVCEHGFERDGECTFPMNDDCVTFFVQKEKRQCLESPVFDDMDIKVVKCTKMDRQE